MTIRPAPEPKVAMAAYASVARRSHDLRTVAVTTTTAEWSGRAAGLQHHQVISGTR
jgi:hypothetical protein